MASIRKRGDRPKPWQARYLDPEGRQRSASFTRKVDAQRFLATVEADVLRGSYVDPDAGRVTFASFAEQWLDAQAFGAKTREGTASHLRAHLLPAFGRMELRHIRPSTVQSWVGAASRDHAPSYVRLLLTTLSSVLSAAVEDGLIARNPCRSKAVQAPTVPPDHMVPWPVERVEAVVAAMAPRYRGTAVVAAGCGLRQGEAFGVRPVDVDFLGRKLHVRQQVKHVTGQGTVIDAPKRGRTRTVPLPDSVGVSLAEHLRSFPPDDDGGLVFTNSDGGPLNRGGFNDRVWRPALIEAGVSPNRDTGFHQLRHHYASVLLAHGVSIRALADYLGHADPGFTLRVYCHLMPADEDRARQAVDGVHGADVAHTWPERGEG